MDTRKRKYMSDTSKKITQSVKKISEEDQWRYAVRTYNKYLQQRNLWKWRSISALYRWKQREYPTRRKRASVNNIFKEQQRKKNLKPYILYHLKCCLMKLKPV